MRKLAGQGTVNFTVSEQEVFADLSVAAGVRARPTAAGHQFQSIGLIRPTDIRAPAVRNKGYLSCRELHPADTDARLALGRIIEDDSKCYLGGTASAMSPA
jgi:hypothetical protein